MFKCAQLAALLCLALLLPPIAAGQTAQSAPSAERLQLQQYLLQKDNRDLAAERRREQAEWIQSDFVRKANSFALLWAEFAAQSNANHLIDIKHAKKLSKAFHELETARGWPAKEK
jgi:hypothetical protein